MDHLSTSRCEYENERAGNSVTRWLDYFYNFWPFAKTLIFAIAKTNLPEYYQSVAKYLKLAMPLEFCQR